MTDSSGKVMLDSNYKPIKTNEYVYKTKDGKTVVIQDHKQGHTFPDGGTESTHFNVRPIENTRTGKVEGTQSHYYFD